jgi:hypothetical protein
MTELMKDYSPNKAVDVRFVEENLRQLEDLIWITGTAMENFVNYCVEIVTGDFVIGCQRIG